MKSRIEASERNEMFSLVSFHLTNQASRIYIKKGLISDIHWLSNEFIVIYKCISGFAKIVHENAHFDKLPYSYMLNRILMIVGSKQYWEIIL